MSSNRLEGSCGKVFHGVTKFAKQIKHKSKLLELTGSYRKTQRYKNMNKNLLTRLGRTIKASPKSELLLGEWNFHHG